MSCRLVYPFDETGIRPDLAEESVPNVLGMKDIIQRFNFEVDVKAKKLYLEWKA